MQPGMYPLEAFANAKGRGSVGRLCPPVQSLFDQDTTDAAKLRRTRREDGQIELTFNDNNRISPQKKRTYGMYVLSDNLST